jgi:ubiquitin
MGTGVTSLVTEPLQELVTGRDVSRGQHIYQPQSESGKALAGGVGAIFKPVGDYLGTALPRGIAAGAEFLGADPKLAEDIGEGSGRVAEAATFLAPFKGARGVRAFDAVPDEAARLRAREPTPFKKTLPKGGSGNIGLARAEGFKITPDVASIQPERVGMPQTGITRQRLSGPAVKPRFQIENQKIANRNAARDLGLDESQPLSTEIKKAFDAHNAVANEIAQTVQKYTPDQQFLAAAEGLGARIRNNQALENNPKIEGLRERMKNIENLTGQQMLDTIREFRAEAKVSLQSLDDFSKHQAGRTLREAADLVESALERSATDARTGLVAEFKKTRVRAAKAHDVEAALIGDNVNMSVLKNIGPENLSGGLQRLARIAEEFPDLTKTQSTIHSGDSSLSMAFSPIKLTAQRAFGRGQTERLLSDKFQKLYGDERAFKADPPIGPSASLESAPTQGDAFGGPLDLELPPGIAGGAMPSDARRLGSTVGPQAEALGPLLDMNRPIGEIGGPVPSRLRTPEQAPSMFSESQPIDLEPPPGRAGRRREPEVDRGEGERRARIIAERQAVLDRPVGTRPNAGIADELLSDPDIRRAVEGDTRALRSEIINPGDELPIGGQVAPPTQGPIVPETGDFARRSGLPEEPISGIELDRQNVELPIGDNNFRGAGYDDAAVQQARQQLADLGFTAEEIEEILRSGG